MNSKPVIINNDQCNRVGEIIKNLKLRPDFYRREFISLKTDNETKCRMLFFAVAICHQTYFLRNPKLNLFGWDYLEHVFLKLAKQKSQLLNPSFLSKTGAGNLIKMIKPLFSHDGMPENCTLDRLEERVVLMKEAGKILLSRYENSVRNMLDKADCYLFGNGEGLYEILACFTAFSDPLRKKSTFFIKLLQEANLVKIHDPENFIPIMDYHMQRVLLRLGCVEIIDPGLRQKLINRTEINSDHEIRSACVEAFRIIAGVSGNGITRMNDIFWSLGRSCCNETMLCVHKYCEKSPCTFTQIVDVDIHDFCIFANVCKGNKDENYRKLWQPIIKTHFY